LKGTSVIQVRSPCFGALANTADGSDMLLFEPIFVAVNDDPVVINTERDVGDVVGQRKLVVIRVLEKLERETNIPRIQILCQSANY
jgi:hypothetical protein